VFREAYDDSGIKRVDREGAARIWDITGVNLGKKSRCGLLRPRRCHYEHGRRELSEKNNNLRKVEMEGGGKRTLVSPLAHTLDDQAEVHAQTQKGSPDRKKLLLTFMYQHNFRKKENKK